MFDPTQRDQLHSAGEPPLLSGVTLVIVNQLEISKYGKSSEEDHSTNRRGPQSCMVMYSALNEEFGLCWAFLEVIICELKSQASKPQSNYIQI